MNSHTVLLKSAKVGRVLLWVIRIYTALTVISKIFALIENAIIPATPQTIDALQRLLNLTSQPLFSAGLAIAIPLLSFVWIYRLHNDLHQCYDRYPISSLSALLSLIFLIFSWGTLMTIARYFKAETGRLHNYGILIHRLVIMMYGIPIVKNILRQSIYTHDAIRGFSSIRNIPKPLAQAGIAFDNILSLAFMFVILAIAQTIVNGIQLKAHQINCNCE